jgi:mono/diheme cytochrome c family protein
VFLLTRFDGSLRLKTAENLVNSLTTKRLIRSLRSGSLRSVLCAVVAISVTSGCDRSKPGPTSPSADQWILDPPLSVAAEMAQSEAGDDPGPRLFQHYCAVCHGPEGRGDGQYYSDDLDCVPADLTRPEILGPLPDDHVAKVIREGSAGVGKSALCPPWGRVLSDHQIAAVVRHVSKLAVPSAEP